VNVIIHTYKDGRKIYYRGDLKVTDQMSLESVLIVLGQQIGEPILEIVEDTSEYTIVVLNDKVIEFVEERNRLITNSDTLKLFPQVVGG